MHCPLCGSTMTVHEPPESPEIDWDLDGDELSNAILTAEQHDIERYECTCPQGCFQRDFPLYYHHPLRGINSRPGDSWSLSWVK